MGSDSVMLRTSVCEVFPGTPQGLWHLSILFHSLDTRALLRYNVACSPGVYGFLGC